MDRLKDLYHGYLMFWMAKIEDSTRFWTLVLTVSLINVILISEALGGLLGLLVIPIAAVLLGPALLALMRVVSRRFDTKSERSRLSDDDTP